MKRVILTVITIALLMIGSAVPSFANVDAPVRGVTCASGAEGNMVVMVYGQFQYELKDVILAQINAYRYEACKEGVPDPRNSSRRLTMADYKPIKWSSAMEQIAMTRAAEGCVHIAHVRPNGLSTFSLHYDGIFSSGENLAWNADGNILEGIRQWHDEKSDWVNQNDETVTGHYTAMIDPNHTYIGVAAFKPTNGYGAVAAEFQIKDSMDETQIGVSGNYLQQVEVFAKNIQIACNLPDKMQVGESMSIMYTARTSYANDLGQAWSPHDVSIKFKETTYSVNNKSVLKIDRKGNIKALKPGTAKVTIGFDGLEKVYTIKVTKK